MKANRINVWRSKINEIAYQEKQKEKPFISKARKSNTYRANCMSRTKQRGKINRMIGKIEQDSK